VQASASLTTSYTYDSQGALTTITYPGGPYPTSLTYTLDAMERPTALSGMVSQVTYNAANQTTGGSFPACCRESVAETRTYNSLHQLTRIQQSYLGPYCSPNCTWLDMTYNYTGGQNNGQIASSVDAVSGETITYQYDALQRLVSAASNKNWTEAYSYDGFGNLTGMAPTGTAGAPSLSLTLDPGTNRVTGPGSVSYDANGNLQGTALWALAYDVANRVVLANYANTYLYDSDNRRIYYRAASGVETVYVYGAGGEKLAAYTIGGVSNNVVQLTLQSQNVYLAGRLISAEGTRWGPTGWASVRWGTYGSGTPNGRTYYPFGAEYRWA